MRDQYRDLLALATDCNALSTKVVDELLQQEDGVDDDTLCNLQVQAMQLAAKLRQIRQRSNAQWPIQE